MKNREHRNGDLRAPDKSKLSVLVADDHPMMRSSVVQMVESQPDMQCCGEAGSVCETLDAVAKHEPDMLIMEMRLKSGDGIELIKSLRARFPELRILVFTQLEHSLYAERTLRAGAMGYLGKDQPAKEVLEAVRTVAAGEVYLTRGLAALMLNRVVGASRKNDGSQPLTDRELHVLGLLGTGMSTREIATTLKISFKTIESHRENIKRKLGLRSAAALIHHAVEWAREQHVLPKDGSRDPQYS